MRKTAETVTPMWPARAIHVPPYAVVADDDANMVQLVGHMLRQRGMHVEVASDGLGLIRRIVDGPYLPDVIITDVQMPGMNGLEVLAWMRHRKLDLPVIVVTGCYDPRIADYAMTLGAFGILSKPFSLDALRAHVEVALQEP